MCCAYIIFVEARALNTQLVHIAICVPRGFAKFIEFAEFIKLPSSPIGHSRYSGILPPPHLRMGGMGILECLDFCLDAVLRHFASLPSLAPPYVSSCPVDLGLYPIHTFDCGVPPCDTLLQIEDEWLVPQESPPAKQALWLLLQEAFLGLPEDL